MSQSRYQPQSYQYTDPFTGNQRASDDIMMYLDTKQDDKAVAIRFRQPVTDYTLSLRLLTVSNMNTADLIAYIGHYVVSNAFSQAKLMGIIFTAISLEAGWLPSFFTACVLLYLAWATAIANSSKAYKSFDKEMACEQLLDISETNYLKQQAANNKTTPYRLYQFIKRSIDDQCRLIDAERAQDAQAILNDIKEILGTRKRVRTQAQTKKLKELVDTLALLKSKESSYDVVQIIVPISQAHFNELIEKKPALIPLLSTLADNFPFTLIFETTSSLLEELDTRKIADREDALNNSYSHQHGKKRVLHADSQSSDDEKNDTVYTFDDTVFDDAFKQNNDNDDINSLTQLKSIKSRVVACVVDPLTIDKHEDSNDPSPTALQKRDMSTWLPSTHSLLSLITIDKTNYNYLDYIDKQPYHIINTESPEYFHLFWAGGLASLQITAKGLVSFYAFPIIGIKSLETGWNWLHFTALTGVGGYFSYARCKSAWRLKVPRVIEAIRQERINKQTNHEPELALEPRIMDWLTQAYYVFESIVFAGLAPLELHQLLSGQNDEQSTDDDQDQDEAKRALFIQTIVALSIGCIFAVVMARLSHYTQGLSAHRRHTKRVTKQLLNKAQQLIDEDGLNSTNSSSNDILETWSDTSKKNTNPLKDGLLAKGDTEKQGSNESQQATPCCQRPSQAKVASTSDTGAFGTTACYVTVTTLKHVGFIPDYIYWPFSVALAFGSAYTNLKFFDELGPEEKQFHHVFRKILCTKLTNAVLRCFPNAQQAVITEFKREVDQEGHPEQVMSAPFTENETVKRKQYYSVGSTAVCFVSPTAKQMENGVTHCVRVG